MAISLLTINVNDPLIGYKRIIKGWIKNIISRHNKKVGEINICFCSNDIILDLNIRYLKHYYYTDVLTFPYNENKIISGDIFISTDQIYLNSERYRVFFYDELFRVIAHGILHLLDYNDKTSEQRKAMREAENIALKDLSFTLDFHNTLRR
ncbi:MAG: rRNA maturation RNase YbeY [Bacteroidales bacterium]|nr:rRNA maturation RNase YbeY [Bacteroidales bacterium]